MSATLGGDASSIHGLLVRIVLRNVSDDGRQKFLMGKLTVTHRFSMLSMKKKGKLEDSPAEHVYYLQSYYDGK